MNIPFLEGLVILVIGGIIVVACERRYMSWGTPRSDLAIRINIMVFLAFAVGLSITKPHLITRFYASPEGYVLCLFSVYAGIAFSFLLHGDGTPAERLGLGTIAAVIPTFIAAAILNPADGEQYPPVFACALFIGMMFLAGIVHGVLGPVISAVNISMSLALIWNEPATPNLAAYFDVLTGMGMDSESFKVVFIVSSTFLGLLEYLRSMPVLVTSLIKNLYGNPN